jgi:hypothetical protein
MLQIAMQPHGPVYFVEVTGVMTTTSSEEIKKTSKCQSEQVIAAVKDSVVVYKSKPSKHLEKAPSPQSSKGTVWYLERWFKFDYSLICRHI